MADESRRRILAGWPAQLFAKTHAAATVSPAGEAF
jgi:hypothetical protein